MNDKVYHLSLNKKLLSLVVFVGFLFTIFWTYANIVQTRSLQEKLEQKHTQYLENTLLPGITISAWNLDRPQLKIQIEGLLQNSNVVRVSLSETKAPDRPLVDQRKPGQYSDLKVKEYRLYSPVSSDEKSHFATLNVYSTSDTMTAELKSEIINSFASEGLEIFLLCVVIFCFFKLLVTNKLATISHFFKKNQFISQSTPELPHRRKVFSDEIDELFNNINLNLAASKKYQKEIETLKDRAEEANRTKSIFLTNINHELRTPLNTILGVAELLPIATDATQQKSLIEMQSRACAHLLQLIDEILDLSKIEAHEVKVESKVVCLRDIVESCRQLTEFDFREKKNKLSIQFSDSFPKAILGDESRLSQIILNLITNANKFTANGFVSIAINDFADRFTLVVSDSGVGIAEDKLEQIFAPFKQIEIHGTSKIKGYGIGLSITKALVKLMNGQITVESKLEKGTTFTIHLPLRLAPPELLPTPDAKSIRLDNDGKPIKVLVVEDTEEIRIIIGEFLKKTPFQMTYAANGKEAVDRFQTDSYSLILMDLQMPIMNGYQATREIRQLEASQQRSKVPIVAITAYTTKTDLDMALEAGCDGYVTKPFTKVKLLDSMHHYTGPNQRSEFI